MLSSPTTMGIEKGEHVVNLDDCSVNLKQEIHISEDLTLEAMNFHNLLSLHIYMQDIFNEKNF
jgi:hypothetical protein